jgi:hypothetical protein
LHHLFLGEWKAAYPDARLFAAACLRRRRKDLAFDADLGDAPDPLGCERAAEPNPIRIMTSRCFSDVRVVGPNWTALLICASRFLTKPVLSSTPSRIS